MSKANPRIHKMITIDEAMAARLDDYRFAYRIRSDAAAIRELMTIGLEALEKKDNPAAERSLAA